MKTKAVVVDTNLIFSALVSRASKIREILFYSNLAFYCPNFVITEIYIHKDKLLRYSKLNEKELYLYLNEIVERITFIPSEYISKVSREKAYDLCKDVDEKDTPFVALAIELKIPLWTGDKRLKEGLRSKGFVNFYIG
jgi:putative PIN family toxin of toxin-antitoxin system